MRIQTYGGAAIDALNSIKFNGNPTHSAERNIKGSIAGITNSILPEVVSTTMVDVSSMKDLKKVRGMMSHEPNDVRLNNHPMLNLLIRTLIARNVLFIADCLVEKDDVTGIGKKSARQIGNSGLSPPDVTNVLNFKVCNVAITQKPIKISDDETKIYEIMSEDAFFLMHMLSMISNQDNPDNRKTLDQIKRAMDLMWTVIHDIENDKKLAIAAESSSMLKVVNSGVRFAMDVAWENPSLRSYLPDNYQSRILAVKMAINRIINDLVVRNAKNNGRFMSFMHTACRPTSGPANGKVQPHSDFSQECAKFIDSDQIDFESMNSTSELKGQEEHTNRIRHFFAQFYNYLNKNTKEPPMELIDLDEFDQVYSRLMEMYRTSDPVSIHENAHDIILSNIGETNFEEMINDKYEKDLSIVTEELKIGPSQEKDDGMTTETDIDMKLKQGGISEEEEKAPMATGGSRHKRRNNRSKRNNKTHKIRSKRNKIRSKRNKIRSKKNKRKQH